MPAVDGPPAPDEIPLTCCCALETGCVLRHRRVFLGPLAEVLEPFHLVLVGPLVHAAVELGGDGRDCDIAPSAATAATAAATAATAAGAIEPRPAVADRRGVRHPGPAAAQALLEHDCRPGERWLDLGARELKRVHVLPTQGRDQALGSCPTRPSVVPSWIGESSGDDPIEVANWIA